MRFTHSLPLLIAAAAMGVSAPALTQQRATAPSAPAAARLTGDLALVQRHLEGMQSLIADFTQTDRRDQRLSGRLTLRSPGRIRFQYQPGVPMLIVADGRSLTLIDYEVRQVQRWPIRNSPLAVLIDPAANLIRFARLRDTGEANTVSVEVRDPARPEYGMMTMVFQRDAAAPAGLRLYGWVSLDAQGNRTSIRLSNHRYNQPVPDSSFRWRDPRPQTRNR